MASRAHIQYKGDPATLKKHLRPEIKAILQELVSDWHDNTLPEHFTERGRRRWRYRARTRKYRNRKRKNKGHGNPLVYSGELKRYSVRRARVSGSSRSARATMTTPWYATRAFQGKSTYADEMTGVTRGESEVMAKDMGKRMEFRLNKIKTRSTTKVR